MPRSVKTSKDPTIFTVPFEDAAVLLGLIVTFVGIVLTHYFNNPYLDGAASIMIGVILATVAVLLVYESKGLLIGESADPQAYLYRSRCCTRPVDGRRSVKSNGESMWIDLLCAS